MSPLQRDRGTLRSAAFSLVEVTLALGIVSFAVLPILGTLSFGLTAIHDAKKDMTHTQVIAQVESTLLQTPFDTMDSFASSGPFFFDQVGRQLDSVTRALYSATVAVTPGSGDTYPGAPSGLSTSAKAVKITVSTVRPGTTHALSSSCASFIIPKS